MAAVTVGLLLAGAPVAYAAPSDPSFPSQQEVDAARQQVEDTARSVDAIQADYAAANQEMASLEMAAAQAAEAYNGAVWRLQQAQADAKAARLKAVRAERRIARQRNGIGALVSETYQGGSSLGQVGAYLTSTDPDALLDRFAAFKGASATMQARLDRFSAAWSLHQVFQREAHRAVTRADRAEQQAAVARQNAQDAVAAQQAAVSEIQARKDALVHELAQAQSISVDLAQQRQAALERRAELRRQRAAERAAELARQRAAEAAAERAREAREAARERAAAARAEAAEQAEAARARAQEAREARQAAAAREAAAQQRAREEAREEARDEARREARIAAREARQARAEAREAREEARQQRIAARQERRERRQEMREQRREQAAAARAAQPAAGASSAVSFAMAQLGEPYVWGGSGPDVWDCSGLTAGAWGSAGGYLSHYSVAQYYETTRISYSELRPGDLIFWSSNGAPSGIFHVAMYIGNGQMIHAANPSDPVKIDSVWYWESPDFFGRV